MIRRVILGGLLCAALAACGGTTADPSQPTPVAEPEAPKPIEVAKPTKAPPAFPADWVGKWHGNVVAKSSRQERTFGMILVIAEIDPSRYQFQITYALDSGNNVRNYELVAIDAESGRYQIDEKNGIVIDATYRGQTLYTLFAVGAPGEAGAAVVDIRYTMTDQGIRFDVTSSTPSKATPTGPEGAGVKNIPFNGIQRALLKRLPSSEK